MKKDRKIIVLSFSFIIFVLLVNSVFADNPIVQTNYTADPAPLVYNETFYVYTGHDEDSANGWFDMREWRCYSSTDMANWTDLGSPMNLDTFSWSNVDAWAGQCIYRNGKFYYYVPIRISGDNFGIGVGVSDKPEGPFTDAIGQPLITGNGYIDPAVFIDDDGQAYLYWGNPGCWWVKLNSNMISYSGSVVEIPQNSQTVGNQYAEAPWLYKRNNLYYLIFAGDGTAGVEDICYSTGASPTGPWNFKGRIMAPNGSWTIHPGITDYLGNSYYVYHNIALDPNSGGFHRSVCIEKFTYNADGTIPLINVTTTGSPQIGTLNPFDQIEAETICWESGVETEKCGEGGMDVCNIENGDYIKVKGVDFGSGATSFDARVASSTSGGNIELRLDSTSGTLVGTCAVTGTGGWQTWVTKSTTISSATGKHDLYLRFTGGSGFLFNINWWKFSGGSTPAPTVEPTPDLTPAPTAVPTIGPTPVPGTISIACGSSSEVGSFQPDQYYSGGSTFNNTNTIDVSAITSNPPPAALFNNERYGAMSYTIPGFTAGNSYAVTLYFAETYLTSSGSRLFNVSINGIAALSDFDIYATAGGQNKAIARSFTTNADSSGQIAIQFTAVTENPKINGIGIVPATNNERLGDVNGNGTVDIVDALLIAQYYVGLNPSGFLVANADVNCSGTIDIVDALLVAQYYVGLLTSFPC